MTEQEPTDNMILMRIVEVIGRRKLHADQGIFEVDPARPTVVINGDQYNTHQAGAVGPSSSAEKNTFAQIWHQKETDIDLVKLSLELANLRANMRKLYQGDLEQDLTIAEIARAELCAKRNDGPSAMEHLRAAGIWALEVAKSSGVEMAAAVIETAMDTGAATP